MSPVTGSVSAWAHFIQPKTWMKFEYNCWTVGRYQERETQALVEKGYWVFLPPYVSLLEANQVLLSLQALGLEGYRVIYDGDWKNSHFTGLFYAPGKCTETKERP